MVGVRTSSTGHVAGTGAWCRQLVYNFGYLHWLFPRISMSLRMQVFLARGTVRIIWNLIQPPVMFPGNPDPEGIIAFIKFSFASHFRIEILSKATFLFNSHNNLTVCFDFISVGPWST